MSAGGDALGQQVGLEDLVGGARIDVVGAFEHPALHGDVLHQVVDRGNRLLVRRRAGVDDVLRRLLALVLHRVEEQAVVLLEHRQHRLAGHRRPAAERRPRPCPSRAAARAFSAKSGQSDAGSTTTASSFLPSSPPFLFCSSISIRTVSFSVVSLMAIVPDSECSTPTLIVPCADAAADQRQAGRQQRTRSAISVYALMVHSFCRLNDIVPLSADAIAGLTSGSAGRRRPA